MSGSRGNVPESTETKWLALLMVLGIVALGVWFGARWMVVIPILAWALLNYEIMAAFGLLDAHGERWRAYAHEAMTGLVQGRLASWDFTWSGHLWPLHEDVASRTSLVWIATFGIMTVLVLFRSRGGGLVRAFSLTGLAKRPVFRAFGIALTNGALKALVKLFAAITFTRKLIVSEKKEWRRSAPSFIGFQSLAWKTSLVSTRFWPDARNIPAPSMTPAEWVLTCVATPARLEKGEVLTREEFVQACREAMKPQLGPEWRGVERARPHARALLALMYVNRVKGDSESRAFADRLTTAFVTSSPARRDRALLAVAAPVLSDGKALERIDRWASRHAWTNTAMIGVYGRCGPFRDWGGGDAGVLPTASFLWLKEIDRHLWYALNNVGRRAFHVEGAGAVCHFFHERIAKTAIHEPMLDEAIVGTNEDGPQKRLHGILGYLIDNQMVPDPSEVNLDLIRRILHDEED